MKKAKGKLMISKPKNGSVITVLNLTSTNRLKITTLNHTVKKISQDVKLWISYFSRIIGSTFMILLESRDLRQWLSLISPCLRSLSFGSTLEKLKKLLKSLSQDAHQTCNVFRELFRSITISFKRTTSFLMKLRKEDSRLQLKESTRIYGRDGKYI